MTSIVTLQDDNLLIPRENDPEKWKEKILWKTRFEKERKALLPSTAKRFYSLNFSNYVLTYSIETEESMQDSFSPRVRPVPFVAPFSMPASARRRRRQQLPLSRRETFFKVPFRANDHQGLFLSPMRNAARVENPAGRLFFPRHPPTFSSLPSLSLSLSPPTRTRTNITGLKYVS